MLLIIKDLKTEQLTENPRVGSSILSLGTISKLTFQSTPRKLRAEFFRNIRQFPNFKKILNRPLFMRHRTLTKYLTSSENGGTFLYPSVVCVRPKAILRLEKTQPKLKRPSGLQLLRKNSINVRAI